jgi:hypothetical protein
MAQEKITNRWRGVAALPVIPILGLASYWTIRLAVADQLFRANSLPALTRAVRLAPGNAQYFAWLAEYQEAEGFDPNPALATACRLNPFDSSVWIRRGLRAEFEGDYTQAEKFLLEAARIDKLLDPRATLANYYFRRNNSEQFWRWTREALAIGYGDLAPMFRLCWRMSDDPELIRSRAQPPPRPYLFFLLAENHLAAADPVARELAKSATPEDAAVLLDFIDRVLARGANTSSARNVWSALCIRSLIPLAPSASPLTNGDFRVAPSSRGFDWRVSQTPDISAVRINPRGLRIDLSGRQPEECELLAQFIPLTPGKTCRLRFSYRTSGAPIESGLQWRILDASSAPLSSDDGKQAELRFSTREASLARLALEYKRVAGTSRWEGSVTLHDIELECAP